ncbi:MULTISPECIES: hypothetical protein [Ramlibacter]|uniref:Uncharacterized protein n=1 Tax=Ramlibacter aquaticus TaxID=2780094 RepID=A0ABR9SEW8_9BURK|nr:MULTISPECIES: hypothetical protein [Ramlibacter]MBE7940905.1 hypothetical protein [Ramlibacter aquaticus]
MRAAPAPRDAALDAGHAAPHRDRTSAWALGAGLVLGPAAFFLQMAVAVPLLSNGCDLGWEPRVGAIPGLHGLALAVDVVALVLVVCSAAIAAGAWRRTAGEKPGGGHRLLGSGDGRTRFMAMAGLIANLIVGAAVLYVLLAHALLTVCGT